MCRAAGKAQCKTCPDARPVVLPENEDSVTLWCEVCNTCWRIGVLGERLGLDYMQVEQVARWHEIELRTPRIRNGIRLLERLTMEMKSGA